ncbi:hypothetical protein ACFTTN_03050 [Streptomyces niveus]|uniref:hypothetical protein n=1 Tax=Streptomyces niveus TaxID=193462 RepID=UPI003638488B
MKISIADHWQRQGLGRRMVGRAMRGVQDFHWTTTHQSPDAQRFFPVLAHETGAAFTAGEAVCSHIRATGHTPRTPRFERPQYHVTATESARWPWRRSGARTIT